MKMSSKFILLAYLIALCAWPVGAWLDFYFFHRFLTLPERLAVICFFIGVSLFLFWLHRREYKAHEEFFFNLINQSNDAIILLEPLSGRFLHVNQRAETALGYTWPEFSRRLFTSLDLYTKGLGWDDFLRQVQECDGLIYEGQQRRRDGSLLPVEVNIKFVAQGRHRYLLAVCRDITERKRAEEWYRSILRTTKEGFWVTDAKGRFLEVNEAYCRLTGRRQVELLQLSIYELFEEPEKVVKHLENVVLTGSTTFEAGHRRRDGGRLHLEVSVNYAPVEGGRFFAFVRDITERKHMEEALSTEKERLSVTLRSIADGVIATDTRGRVVLMNHVAEKLTGWTQEQALGLPVSQVFRVLQEQQGSQDGNPVDRVLQARRPLNLYRQAVLMARDGTRRLLTNSGAPIIDRHQQIIGVVLVFQDISGQRRMEEELMKVEKLSSLGVLAGGIAHDFNNILAAIMGNISLAAMASDGNEELHQCLDKAEKAALRAKHLAQQLLTFAKGGVPVKAPANLKDLIRESAEFASSGSQSRCEMHFSDHLWLAEVDSGQISQVLQNLVINAIQAMPQGGVIRIAAANLTLRKGEELPLAPGKYLKISIQDHGQGIWPDHLAKIFDPYFTTKAKGSGLGLATAYSIIKNHNGHIAVESQVGQGTTFHIYLPALGRTGAAAAPAEGDLVPGRGKILVMDDDEMIRSNLGMLLKRLGYEAELAEDGARALEIYQQALQSGAPFAAVILDLTVPGGMGGRETVKRLLNLDPQARAIVFSGYSDDPIMSDYAKFGFRGFIKKPYLLQDLSETLHRVLAQAARRLRWEAAAPMSPCHHLTAI